MAGKRENSKNPGNSEDRSNSLCNGCPAICCTNLAMPVDKPRNAEDREDLKWHLHYDTVRVIVRNRRWYLLVEGKCIYLDGNNLCTIYSNRPDKCRRHNPPSCEYYAGYYDVILNTPEDLERYFEEERKKKRSGKKSVRKKRREQVQDEPRSMRSQPGMAVKGRSRY